MTSRLVLESMMRLKSLFMSSPTFALELDSLGSSVWLRKTWITLWKTGFWPFAQEVLSLVICDLTASLGTYTTYGVLHDGQDSDFSSGQTRALSLNNHNFQSIVCMSCFCLLIHLWAIWSQTKSSVQNYPRSRDLDRKKQKTKKKN